MGTIPPLPSFTAGQVLTASQLNQFTTWASYWQNPPMCRASLTADTSGQSSGSWHVVSFDQDDIDNDSMHSTVSNTSRITINTTGYYQITASLSWTNDPSGTREAYVYKNNNGDTSLSTGTGLINTTAAYTSNFITTVLIPPMIFSFTAGDYIELYGFQNTGGTLVIKASTFMQARLVGKV